MSHSYKTVKPSVQASRNLVRENGEIPSLRIVIRKPFHGDINPFNKRQIQNLLKMVPDKYLFGLKSIELRPRNGDIGRPFGEYLSKEKTILLYSLPMSWGEISLGSHCLPSLKQHGANITNHDEKFNIFWEKESDLFFWFFMYVLTHELGHHYTEQYKHRNGSKMNKLHDEIVADIHSERINEIVTSIFLELASKKESL